MKPLNTQFRPFHVSQDPVTELPSSPSSPRLQTSLQATLPRVSGEQQSLSAAQLKTVIKIVIENTADVPELIRQLMESREIIVWGRNTTLIAVAQISELAAISIASDKSRKVAESLLRKAGLLKTSGKLMNGILCHVLQLKKGPASKYARAILYSWERGISISEFVEFVKKEGGVEEINRRLRKSHIPIVQKPVPLSSNVDAKLVPIESAKQGISLESSDSQNVTIRKNFGNNLADILAANAPRYTNDQVTFFSGIFKPGTKNETITLELLVMRQGHKLRRYKRRRK